MKPVNKQYIREIKKRYGGYHATWAPGVPLQVGDIGDFDKDGAFQRLANLSDLKIAFEIRTDNTNNQLDYTSQNKVDVITKLSGQIVPNSVLKDIDAGVIVAFKKGSSVLFKAKNVRYDSIKNIIQVENEVIKLYGKNNWKKEWCIITELAIAESATIIISNSSSSKIELKANVGIGTANINIADASLDFSIQSAKDLSTTIIAQEGLTPLFKVRKLKLKGGLFTPPIPDGLKHTVLHELGDKPISHEDSSANLITLDNLTEEVCLSEYKPEEIE